jgi:hypothetical protein
MRAEYENAFQSHPPDQDLFLDRKRTASALADHPSLRCRPARGTNLNLRNRRLRIS